MFAITIQILFGYTLSGRVVGRSVIINEQSLFDIWPDARLHRASPRWVVNLSARHGPGRDPLPPARTRALA